MTSRRFAISIIGAALSARTAGAQSTETLGSYERAVQFQVSAATNSAFVGSAEFPIHLPDDVSITPEVGMGWVLRARGDFSIQPGSGSQATRTSTGWVYSVGLALRWRYFVIEQHLLQINDADRALRNGETAPLSFGVRF